jgi:hypothetical protein
LPKLATASVAEKSFGSVFLALRQGESPNSAHLAADRTELCNAVAQWGSVFLEATETS